MSDDSLDYDPNKPFDKTNKPKGTIKITHEDPYNVNQLFKVGQEYGDVDKQGRFFQNNISKK